MVLLTSSRLLEYLINLLDGAFSFFLCFLHIQYILTYTRTYIHIQTHTDIYTHIYTFTQKLIYFEHSFCLFKASLILQFYIFINFFNFHLSPFQSLFIPAARLLRQLRCQYSCVSSFLPKIFCAKQKKQLRP